MLAGGTALDLVKVDVMAADAIGLVDALDYVPDLAAPIIRLLWLQVSRFVGVSIPRSRRGRAAASAAGWLDGQGRDGREAQRQRNNQ